MNDMAIPYLWIGFVTSAAHVLSGPDHLAAITPISIHKQHSTWTVGLNWGLGHLTGMLLIGGLLLLFKDSVPMESISEFSDFLVGFLLIGVGIWGLIKRREASLYSPPLKAGYNKSSFGIGVLHGFAGISHFVLLLPMIGLTSAWDTANYFLGFTIGTIIVMTGYSYLLSVIRDGVKNINRNTLLKRLRLFGSLFSLVVGIYWVYVGSLNILSLPGGFYNFPYLQSL